MIRVIAVAGQAARRPPTQNLSAPFQVRREMAGSMILKRASASRSSGEWNDDDFDVLADGVVVGRSFKANAAPVGAPWFWTLDINLPLEANVSTSRHLFGFRIFRTRIRYHLCKLRGPNTHRLAVFLLVLL
jgi:hypothetical protein